MLGLERKDVIATNLLGNTAPPPSLQISPRRKDTTFYLLLLQELECWTLFFLSVEGKWQIRSYVTLLKHHRVCGDSTLDFIFPPML